MTELCVQPSRLWRAGLAAAAAAALAACSSPSAPDDMAGHPPEGGRCMHAGMGGMDHMAGQVAFASLGPTQGNVARGIAVFHEMDGRVVVHAHFTGLAPDSEHGFHVHEGASCASPDGTSAGGHFNPAGTPHGPQDAAHHMGDMPSLKADAHGVIDQKFELHGVTLQGNPQSLEGHTVILHAGPDDYKSQPAGNAGPRIACGVIALHP